MPNRHRPVHRLALSLRAGAVYDWCFAGVILLATPSLMARLHFPVPDDLFLFRLTALPLLFFPFVYWVAAADPRAHRWAVAVSLVYRWAGGLTLGALALLYRPAGLHVFLLTCLIDLLWGVLHFALWRAVSRV